jgi:twinkle protein
MAQVIERDHIDFGQYIRETEAKQKVRPASEYVEDLIHTLFSGKKDPCAYLPWEKTHDKFQFRPGEVTLWAGINGHGKSLVTGQVALSLLGQSERVCIASFEMKPRKTLERMARQWLGSSPVGEYDTPEMVEMARDAYRQFGGWTDRKLWLYDQQGTVDAETILGVSRYCARELKISHIFIDSLMKCVKGEDDYNGQKEFLDELCALARDCNVHIHLVHHIKKLANEEQQPGKFDAKGSGSISDQVDNFVSVWRNKKKERDQQAGKAVALDEPDALLICDKQRNGEWEGRIGLFFDRDSQQFKASAGDRPVSFDAWPHRPWS